MARYECGRRHHRRRHHGRDGVRRSSPSSIRRGRSSSSKPASGCSTSRIASSTASAISTTARTSGPAISSRTRAARGVISRAMAVGGSALHWGGVCNRFSEEDTRLKSMYGLAVDWPIEWADLEKYYCEAERRIGVSGEPSPLPEDERSEPYPMPADDDDLQPDPAQGVGREERHPVLDDAAGEEHGRRLRRPRQVPALQHVRGLSDRRALLAGLDVQAAARREEDPAARSDARAQARARRRDDEDRRGAGGEGRRHRTTTSSTARRRSSIASGYCWSSHLLLLSANSRFPNGLANSSDHVGRYMTGHLAYRDADRSRPEDLSRA